jgi:membrane protein implicated in regulation of membrane protease activity
MEDWIYWMIFAVVMAGIELATVTIFIFGPLAIAATATAVVAGLGGGIELQLAVFIVLSLTTMVALFPVARRHRQGDPSIATNVDALIGSHARTLELISDESLGLIRLNNENWTARTAEGAQPIPSETAVRVVSIAGATAVVEPLESSTNPDS